MQEEPDRWGRLYRGSSSVPSVGKAQWAVMRMIPEKISPATKSDAEKEIFRRLELIDDSDWYFALHSLNLSEHVWKRVGEIDFLLVGPRGIYVLEAKGGGVACERGVWRFTDRFGNSRKKRESPFSQARTAMFSLQSRLEGNLPHGLLSRATFGYAVVFPDCNFDAESVEWSPEMVIDRRQLERKDGLRRSLAGSRGTGARSPDRGMGSWVRRRPTISSRYSGPSSMLCPAFNR